MATNANSTIVPKNSNPYLNADLSYNRAEIMRRAWASARKDLALDIRLGYSSTLRACFAKALRQQWDRAQGYRAIHIERRDRAAALAAMTPNERTIAELQSALYAAQMIDSLPVMQHETAAIRAEIARVQLAA